MNTITLKVNNGRTMSLTQRAHDGATLIHIEDANGNAETISDNEAFISAGDMVMLVNYFRACKRGDEISEYIG